MVRIEDALGQVTEMTYDTFGQAKRTFTAPYKRQILCEADQCKKPGELGALLRREGLYRSLSCRSGGSSGRWLNRGRSPPPMWETTR